MVSGNKGRHGVPTVSFTQGIPPPAALHGVPTVAFTQVIPPPAALHAGDAPGSGGSQ